jgi:glycosyltransferase involved in cell wall biosynthesis
MPQLEQEQRIKVAFASGTDDLNEQLIEKIAEIFPELPLYVVSEFRPVRKGCTWVRYYAGRFWENFARCRAVFRGKSIRLAGVLLVPGVPYRFMRLIALWSAPLYFLAVNEHMNDFLLLRPRSLPLIARHIFWRAKNFLRWEFAGARKVVSEPILEAFDRPARVFPGRAASGKPRVLVVSPYLPFPLSHGGAVRMYNLMRRAAEEFDQILVVFTEDDALPPAELTAICLEVVAVGRKHTHRLPWRGRPEVVEEFASPAFEKALRECVARWKPRIAQLEFTQMAQYAAACSPARTILVEHDVTFDLYDQLYRQDGDWDRQRQARLWRRFETKAWTEVNRVVTMSEKDRLLTGRSSALTLANGVDLERFQPSGKPTEPGRLLFIGSFAHLPNLTALEFFMRDVWPKLSGVQLHVIAGQRHEYYLDHYRHLLSLDLNQKGVEVEGFVSDVRTAYARASVVILPLVASAGTNIKVLEAMAAGKAIVSTPAGVNGLDLRPGAEFLLAEGGGAMAEAIRTLLDSEEQRARLGAAARRCVEEEFGWDAIARRQSALYQELLRS